MTSFRRAQLRRAFRVVNGGTPTSEPNNWDGDVPWATPVDLGIFNGGIVRATGRSLSELGLASGSSAVPGGSLIVSTRAPIGYVAQVQGRTAFNQGCRGLVPTEMLDVRYFRYQLLAMAEVLQSRGQGSTFQELSSDGLAESSIFLPSLTEQRTIADYLDRETARIDALIEKKQATTSLLKERSLSIISESWPGQLILAPDGTPVGIQGLHCVRLGHLSRVQTGLTLDDGRDLGGDANVYPYLRVANVQDGALDLDEVKEVGATRALANRCLLRSGDVLMTEGGDPDKLGRGTVWSGVIRPCLHQNHVFAVRPSPDLLPEYLALITRTPYGRAYFEMTASKTTGIASTSTAKIASFRIPMVAPEVQARIVSSVHQKLGEVETLQIKVEAQTRLLAEHRQALITAAVTGELDVPGVAA